MAGAVAINERDHDHLLQFYRILNEDLKEFLLASRDLGGILADLAEKVNVAFQAQYAFIASGISMTRPDDDTLSNLLQPLCQAVNEIQDFRNSNRHDQEFFNHLSTVSESIVALSWITRTAPATFIRDMRDSGDYYGNRVLSAHRNNPLGIQHVAFITRWKSVLVGLERYVRNHHMTGFDWGAALRTDNILRGGVPAPPPPPPPAPAPAPSLQHATGDPDRSALMLQINQIGQDITQMLRPAARSRSAPATAPISAGPVRPRSAVPAEVGPRVQGPPVPRPPRPGPPPPVPRFILESRKWFVEYQSQNYAMVIDSDDMSESLIVYKCEHIGLEVRRKINGVTIDNTKRSTIALNDVIASVELIRCSNVTIQCSGVVPLMSIDNSDSVQIFLTPNSIGVELITTNSTSVNVCLLNEDGTYAELPVPEQIRTLVLNGRLNSTAVERY